ncbi:MAG: bifunctional diguanylate cyclase/phosphodiesterase [Pseudomonadota bacterium]
MARRLREALAGSLAGLISILCVCICLALGVRALVSWATEEALIRYAERSALGWAEYLQTEMPDLDELLQGRAPDAQQRVVMYFASAIGDARRFQLYDVAGRLSLSTDADGISMSSGTPALSADRPQDWKRALMGEASVRIQRLMEAPAEEGAVNVSGDPPPVYADVVLPLRDVDGRFKGAAQVTLDMSHTWQAIGSILLRAGAALAGLSALAFLAPALGWQVFRRRAKEAERAMHERAHLDDTTGLANRRGFIDAAAAALAAAPAGADDIVVLVFDVDRFKAFNEQNGRSEGDALLRSVAAALRAVLRAGDPGARIGADEFAAILRTPPEERVETIVARVRERLYSPIWSPAAQMPTLSLGACPLKLADGDVEAALALAEIALYEAKAAQDGGLRVFEPAMAARVERRRHVELAIRDGMKEKRFSLSYQPLVDRRSGATVGFEALMRLNDAEGAPISPAEFIPVAEEIGVIVELGNWAIRTAAAAAVHWPAPLHVSVNLSVRQFDDERLAETVEQVLAEAGLPPARFELEVTESLLIANPDHVERQLAALKKLGVSIAMDDFGTGYSSLAYLWRFGFDRLKLDRSFVQAMSVDPGRARDVIAAIVALGHRLGMSVTAEGIETEAEAEALTELGCDILQGYRYGAPLSDWQLREVLAWGKDADDERMVLPPPDRAAG